MEQPPPINNNHLALVPPLDVQPQEQQTEIAIPRTAGDAFTLLSIRAAEAFAASNDPKWAMISNALKQLAAFAGPFPHASARHVKWAYLTVLKRVPQSAEEAGPMAEWLKRIPALATDKAAAAPLLWHYLASCAGKHAEALPIPHGKPGAWSYERGGLTIPCSNDEAYALGEQRHFWSVYQGRLLFVVGCLLQEMAGVPVQVAATPAQAAPAPEAATGPGLAAVPDEAAAPQVEGPGDTAAETEPDPAP